MSIELVSGWHHYCKAEALLVAADDNAMNHEDSMEMLAHAQVHATLALAARKYAVTPGLYSIEADGVLRRVEPDDEPRAASRTGVTFLDREPKTPRYWPTDKAEPSHD